MINQPITVEMAMELAIKEAKLGLATVSPNPPVGAVIISSGGTLLSYGHHKKAGEAHAEIEALKGIENQKLQGATMVVTLEPCAHEGRTPSCAKKIASLPIKKVIYGLQDPNPLVAGEGLEILRRAGIEVESFSKMFNQALEELAEIFLLNMRNKRPFVALKAATTKNAKIRKRSGPLTQQITSDKSIKKVHELRSLYDAVLVGRKTFEIDDPKLNIRLDDITKENYAVVLDFNVKSLEKLKNSSLLKARSPQKVIWVIGKANLEIAQTKLKDQNLEAINLVTIKSPDHVGELLKELWKLDIRSLFVEGGSAVWQSFIKSKFVDRFYWFKSEDIFRAEDVSWLPDLQIENENSLPLEIAYKSTEKLGSDTLTSIRFKT